MQDARVEDLLGKTLVSVEQVGVDKIIFTTTEGEKYKMCHFQDCCESVTIEDIVGDLADLVGEPILLAEEVTSRENPEDAAAATVEHQDDSFTWTFYKFATRKGYVDIRWYGKSNGYYSEEVSFEKC